MKQIRLASFLLFILLVVKDSLAQAPSASPIRPRNKENYDKPGHYEMVIQEDKTEVDPGDAIEFSIFFTGYGEIGGSKVFLNYPKNVFNLTTSYALEGFKPIGMDLAWGNNTVPMPYSTVYVMTLQGYKSSQWDHPTSYIDKSTEPMNLSVTSECYMDNPPVLVHMDTDPHANSGTYTMLFAYTYFNGQEWQGGQRVATFKINGFGDTHATSIIITTLLIAFIGIIPWLIKRYSESISLIKRLYKFISNIIHTRLHP